VGTIRNKKGQTEPFLAVPALIVLFILVILVLGIFRLGAARKGIVEIIEEKSKVGDNVFLINYLKTDNVADLIIESYFNDDFDDLKTKTNEIFTKVFGEKICWRLYIEDKKVEETKDCRWPEKLHRNGEITAKASLPYDSGEEQSMLNIGLGEKP